MPTPTRRSVFADRLLDFPDLVFSDGRELQHRGRWHEFFAARIGGSFDGRLILDIGCNDAGLLATVAAKHASTAFIGIDWKPRALHTAAGRIAAEALKNVALLHARAQDIRRIFGDHELDEIWIFHPEPLDTARELKNRLLAEPFLIDAHEVLRDGGSLILKTDHAGYFDAVAELLAALSDRFAIDLSSRDYWNDPTVQSATAGDTHAGEMTAFESRFVRKRKPIYFMKIRTG
jgi:tRNA (guanine-N7-)-methyltransferase